MSAKERKAQLTRLMRVGKLLHTSEAVVTIAKQQRRAMLPRGVLTAPDHAKMNRYIHVISYTRKRAGIKHLLSTTLHRSTSRTTPSASPTLTFIPCSIFHSNPPFRLP